RTSTGSDAARRLLIAPRGRLARPRVRYGREARRRARARVGYSERSVATSSPQPALGLENQADCVGEPDPARRFFFELGPAFRGEAIELGFPAGVRHLPVGGQEPAVFESVQSGIEGALRHLHDVARDLLQTLRNAVAVNGSGCDDLQNQQVERALGQIRLVRRDTPRTSTYTAVPVEAQALVIARN